MRCTWTNVTERRILVSNLGVTCNSFCELHTLDRLRHVIALPENRLRRRHVLKYATQRPSQALSLTGRSLLPLAASAVRHWVVLLFPQENRQRSKVGAADDTVAIDSGRTDWMRRVFPVLANQRSSRPLLRTDYHSFLEVCRRAADNIGIESGVLPDAALGAVPGPRAGCQ